MLYSCILSTFSSHISVVVDSQQIWKLHTRFEGVIVQLGTKFHVRSKSVGEAPLLVYVWRFIVAGNHLHWDYYSFHNS